MYDRFFVLDVCVHFSWVLYLGVELLSYMVTVFNLLRELPNFFKALDHFAFPPATSVV